MKAYLEAGEFVTTHGIAGELRLYPWSDDASFLSGFKTLYLSPNGGQPHTILQARPHKSVTLVKLEGVDSIAAARPFIGKTAYIARADVQLPAGRWFVQDLLGAPVVDADSGHEYGVIRNITHPGRHDVFEVEAPDGAVHLFPATPPFLVEVDTDAPRALVRPIPGMFGDGETV